MRNSDFPSLPLRLLLSVAARNLRRHARRSAIDIAAIAVSVAVVSFFGGFYRGSYEELLFATLIDYQTAHAQVQTTGFNDRPDTWARPGNVMADWRPLADALRDIRGVSGAAPRLILSAFAGDGREMMPLFVQGIDPGPERGVGIAQRSIVQGADFADDGATGMVLVGDAFAGLFGFEPGSRCMIRTVTSSGSPNVQAFTIRGIFHTGFSPLDKSTLFITLPDAQALADTGDAINKIFVKSASVEAAALAYPAVAEAAARTGYDAKPWKYYARSILERSRVDSFFFAIFISILLALSTATVANTMRVSVHERSREIGAMRATGWRRSEIRRLFLLEALVVGIAGALIGAALGGAACAALAAFPIDLRPAGSSVGIPFFQIRTAPALPDFALAGAVGIVSALVAGVAPASRAAKTDIVRALAESRELGRGVGR